MYTTVRVAPQAAGFCRSWRFDFLAQNYELLQSNNCLLGCERVMETRAEFHFSWVYTFSAMLSSLRNWANHDSRGVTMGDKGDTIPRAPDHYGAPNHCGGRQMSPRGAENLNNFTSTFFNTINVLPKNLRFEHGGAKLASCPGPRLTSYAPAR